MATLQKRALQGVVWSFASYGISQGLRLISNLILTRLLFPDLFGLMALVSTFIIGLQLFSDIGIGPNIVQSRRGDDPDFINTAWTIQTIRGIGLWIASFMIAWPLANFYERSELLWLIPVVGLTTVIDGFNSINRFTLQRNLAFGKIEIFELIVQIISLSVMVIWAFLSPTIWALVVGNLVSSLFKMIYSYWLIPRTRHFFILEEKAVQELILFGKWIFVSTIMTFLASQSDKIILGKLLPLSILGIYSIAIMLADLPRLLLSQISMRVIFTVISKRADLPRDILRGQVEWRRWWMLLSLAGLVAFLTGFGDFIIDLLYDERYQQAHWMLPVLAIGIWPNILAATTTPILLAFGKPFYGALGNFFKVIYMIIVIPLGFSTFGIFGAILAIALNDVPFYFAALYGCWRERILFLAQDVKATLVLTTMIVSILTIRHLLGFDLPFQGIF